MQQSRSRKWCHAGWGGLDDTLLGLQLELMLELLLHKLLLLLLFLLRLSQLLLLLHLLGEGVLLEHLGRLALQFFHARLVRLIEGALVFLSLGLCFALPG